MRQLLLLIAIAFMPLLSIGQESDQQLADHYFNQQEYDKAVLYYERLYDKNPSKFFFNRYLICLEETGEGKQAEKLIKKQISSNPRISEYQIQLAMFYEDHEQASKATKIYESLIDDLPARARDVIALYYAFKAQQKDDFALETLQKGRKLLKKSYPLNYQFADHYRSVGQTELMIVEYLDMIDYHPSHVETIKTRLTSQIDFTREESPEYDILKAELIKRTQDHPSNAQYADMLTWLFIQKKNFSAAFIQVKAVDKKSKSNGKLVFDLGLICIENNDFIVARKCFQYVIEIGDKSTFFLQAHRSLLNVRFKEVTTLRNFTQEELNSTIAEYDAALELFGKRRSSFQIMLEKAHIQAFYANQGKASMELLNEMLTISGLTDLQKAKVKMELGDVQVLHGDVWDASLLYMQVDKSFKYEPIGHMARFKNARIFYYDGEFDYAQSQLDVLKRSTSKLIANDAIQLSLLITDNYGLDSNYIAMNWFANADLLIEQHRYNEAFVLFDSIIEQYPAHSLGDEIQLKKAHAMSLQGKWNEAIFELEELLKYYAYDILADDALFQLGDIYENHLYDSVKAGEYYKKILFEHKGSLYTEEARKRFQKIRETLPETELN